MRDSLVLKLIGKILVSGQCIKASSPELTDYSLLTYSELRALEGIIKNELVMNEVDNKFICLNLK